MNRRSFLKLFAGAVATVAISTRLAAPLPRRAEPKTVKLGYTITEEKMEDGLYESGLARKYAEALARSMEQTKEHIAADIFQKAFGGGG